MMTSMNAHNGCSEKCRCRELHHVADATWSDIGKYYHKVECSNANCYTPATYFLWTGSRWWKLCTEHLVPYLKRHGGPERKRLPD